MPERSSITQVIQIGAEVTPGTAVACPTQLASLLLTPGIKTSKQTFRGSGYKYPAVTALGREWSEFGVSGPMSYSELQYILCSVLKSVTPTGGGAAKTWTFAPDSVNPDTPQTYTIQHGSSVRAEQYPYCFFDQFGWALDMSGGTFNLTGHAIGQAASDGATMTASPAGIAMTPMIPEQVDVFLDTTAAGLGTTQLTRVLKAGYALQSRRGGLWVANSSNTSYVADVELEPGATGTLMLEADSNGMALLSNLRNDQSVFLRVQATGPIITGSTHFKLVFDVAYKVIGNDDFGDDQGVEAINWQLQQVHDPTWGKSMNVSLVNAQATL